MHEFCNSLTRYQRLKTLPVQVGELTIGNLMPIRIQTMTTTDTMNNKATVAQIIACAEAGADLVRVTAPSIKVATHLQIIKKELREAGYATPLVADIHFTPNAAEMAARIVEKVRINPGNYMDKKKFEVLEYDDDLYAKELEQLHIRFSPLVKICKEYGTAMRIGTNHGSLSDRIMSRFGDTAEGMVVSALEFLDVCEFHNYYNVVLSMKSSNPQVMVQAYRLLVKKMLARGKVFPLHLGVTEAGDGDDGRIKSAMGIGALLEDGLGDTVRVSLTEAPELELPVCRNLIERYNLRSGHVAIAPIENINFDPYSYTRMPKWSVGSIGKANVPCVIADYGEVEVLTRRELQPIGYTYNEATDKWNISETAADFIFTNEQILNFDLPGTLKVICHYKLWFNVADKTKCFPFFHFNDYLRSVNKSSICNFILIDDKTLMAETKLFFNQIQGLIDDKTIVWVFETDNQHAMPALRRMFLEMKSNNMLQPIVVKRAYELKVNDRLLLYSAIDLGALLLDGMGDGVWLTNLYSDKEFINRTCFNVLQASRTRTSKTEYISCPSCGRTLFDLQETTAAIRARTSHLKGVKIAIMGCIVNGPGEMADADFGYVGSGVGKITLYKGKEVVKRQLDSTVAVDELIQLIKESGAWVDEKS